jgi:hypothetical protein
MYNGSSNWFDFEMQFSHHAELLKEAEKARLVKSLQERRKPTPALGLSMLDWLGGRLVCWGARLQERAGWQATVNINEICC